MNADEFVALFRAEKDALLEMYLHPDGRSTTKVGMAIAAMNLAADQVQLMREVVDGVLTDAFYTILMGLDGEASLGGQQRQYRVHDDDGPIGEPGDIETAAYEQFQES